MGVGQIGVTEEVADFVAGIRYDDVSPEIWNIAKRCMIDGLGVLLAGSTEPCARVVRSYVLQVEGRQESTLLGKGRTKAPAHLAALVNGTAGHAMDWDDTALSNTPDRTTLLHPTLPPLVTGLAIGEKLRISGRDLLTAFVAGFEVECKIAASIHPDHKVRGFQASNTCGIFGATAAASKLMGLSANQVRNALGVTASMASGVRVNMGTMGKPLHVGRASENGIVSAQLASLGFEADPNGLQGRNGFFQAFGGGFDPEKISGKLGRPFSIVDPGVSVKPYPCGVVGHPAMDSMRKLAIDQNVQPDQVDRIRVSAGSNILRTLRYAKAQTALQGKFCVPFQMAAMIIRRKAGIMEFTDEFVQSPAVQDMMDRVETVIDPEIEALGKDKLVSVIEVRLKDGRVLEEKFSGHYRGGPQNPLSRDELVGKFNDCVQRILNPDEAAKLLNTIDSLESLKDIGTLIAYAAIP